MCVEVSKRHMLIPFPYFQHKMTDFQFGTSKLPPEIKLLQSSERSISETDLDTLIKGEFLDLGLR